MLNVLSFPDTNSSAGSSEEQCPGPGYQKYRALFQFDKRHADEIGFKVGQTIWVT